MVAQLAKKFFAFCRTQRLTTVLAGTRCWCIFPSHTKPTHTPVIWTRNAVKIIRS